MGEGGQGGLRPLHSRGLNPWFAAKPKESGSLRAVPAAKERGDRGRGTSAFEMVLSPGAGIASAVGGLAFFLARLPCLPLPFCPHPPAPLPGGKGENQGYFMQGAPPLASPGAESGRHRSRVANHAPGGGWLSLLPAYPASAGAEPGRHLPWPPHPAAFSETGTSRGSVNKKFEKSSGGSGGLFQESPSVSPFPPSRVSIF